MSIRSADQLGLPKQYAGMVEAHPCQDCEHSARCAQGLACSVLLLFIQTGKISASVPREPCAKVYAQIYKPQPAARRRQSTMLAISLLRADPGRMR